VRLVVVLQDRTRHDRHEVLGGHVGVPVEQCLELRVQVRERVRVADRLHVLDERERRVGFFLAADALDLADVGDELVRGDGVARAQPGRTLHVDRPVVARAERGLEVLGATALHGLKVKAKSIKISSSI
jgi:hypothetical protein